MLIPTLSSSANGNDVASALSATAVRRLVSHDIRTPLAALRASLESLTASLTGEGQVALLARAIEQLLRVELAAEVLCESSLPPAQRPCRCSVEEIARMAWQQLTALERQRVGIAFEESNSALEVDAGLLASSLARLLRNVLADGAQDVLLHGRCEDAELSFTIVDDRPPEAHAELLLSLNPFSDQALRAEVALAIRDVMRLAGRAATHHIGAEHTQVCLRVPCRRLDQGQALSSSGGASAILSSAIPDSARSPSHSSASSESAESKPGSELSSAFRSQGQILGLEEARS